MDTVRLIGVIETTNARRGKGTDGDPIRIVTQYWCAETGELLAEVDPESRERKLEQAVRWALGEVGEFKPPTEDDSKFYWRRELRRRAGL